MTLVKRFFAPEPRERSHEETLHRTIVEELYRRSATVVWFLVPSLFLLGAIVRDGYAASAHVRVAFWATVGCATVRWMVVLYHRRPTTDARLIQIRYLSFSALTALMGWGISLTILFSDPYLEYADLALACVFLTGVHSVALASLGISPPAYVQYIYPSILALLWCLVSRESARERNIMLGLLALYLPCLSMMCYYAYAGARRTMLLGLELRDLALKDSLTGLRNRRFLSEFMAHEAQQMRRTWQDLEEARQRPPQSIGLLLLDLDHFKLVNDQHGHVAGDEVLRQFAAVLQDAVRRPDLVIRWGGEEFVVVARDLTRDAVWDVAERIRRKVEEHPFRLHSGDVLHKTCSIGYALFPFSTGTPDLLTWEQALALGDLALYRAKHTGRNRVVGVSAGGAASDKSDALMRAAKDDFDGAVERGLLALTTDTARLPVGQPR